MVCRYYSLLPNRTDLLLATWTEHHFTDDMQTRQYLCPEVILGAKWGTSANIWSVACVVSLVPPSLLIGLLLTFFLL
jgi:hypothetical protein